MAHVLKNKSPGENVPVIVLRDEETLELKLTVD